MRNFNVTLRTFDHDCDVALSSPSAHPTPSDLVFYYFFVLTFRFPVFRFIAEVRYEPARTLTAHSANANTAVMYFDYTLNTLHMHFRFMVCRMSVGRLQNFTFLPTFVFGNA